MASTTRVYYVGEGDKFEASPDNGKTWKTYTKCKVVDYGGKSYVWAPAGTTGVRKTLAVKHPFLFRNGDPEKPMMQRGRTFFVVAEDGEVGPFVDYLDLDPYEARAAFREANREGLVTEAEYNKRVGPEVLRARAKALLEEADQKEGKPSRGRKVAEARVE